MYKKLLMYIGFNNWRQRLISIDIVTSSILNQFFEQCYSFIDLVDTDLTRV